MLVPVVVLAGIVLFVSYLYYQFVSFAVPPRIEVTEPATDAIAQSADFVVKGRTVPDGRVTVQVFPGPLTVADIQPNADGSFEVKVQLSRGSNHIVVEVLDTTGKVGAGVAHGAPRGRRRSVADRQRHWRSSWSARTRGNDHRERADAVPRRRRRTDLRRARLRGADVRARRSSPLAALSDALDGYLARRGGTAEGRGIILDPLADKALVVPTLVGLALVGAAPPGIAAIIVVRELFVGRGPRGRVSARASDARVAARPR